MTTPISTQPTRTLDLGDGLQVSIAEAGDPAAEGSPVLLLHGGAGAASMTPLVAALAPQAYVITPTHPGFDGTPRPDWADSVADLAVAYLDLLDVLDLRHVLVIGSSVGGWIAAEMGLRDTRGRLAGIVVSDAAGIDAPEAGETVDTRVISPAKLSELAFHNPAFRLDPASMSEQQRAVMAANQRTLAAYAGDHWMADPKLRRRLRHVAVPVLVIWGEEDGVVPLPYGRAYADSFPAAAFVPIPEAGHFPHIEQTALTMAAIGDFVATKIKDSSS
ncbi:MAG: alpha/beta fold hydrolase, partial [Streptosporangiaceae bacterium]